MTGNKSMHIHMCHGILYCLGAFIYYNYLLLLLLRLTFKLSLRSAMNPLSERLSATYEEDHGIGKERSA